MQGDFRIGDWLVQPQINAVERNGKTRHLEPRVMQVLVQLAMHPNEVLSKDRLLEAVWHGTFVGDDVLVRCISEIRYALGDEARASRVIQTIPKNGYRLIAKVSREATESVNIGIPGQEKPDHVGTVRQQVPAPPEGFASHPIQDNASEEKFHVLFATEVQVPTHYQPRDSDQSNDSIQTIPPIDSLNSALHPVIRLPQIFSRYPRRSITVATFLVILLAYIGFAHLSRLPRRTAPDSFWEPLLHGTGPVLICVADHPEDSAIVLYDAKNPDIPIQMKIDPVSVAMSDLDASMKAVNILQSGNKSYMLKPQAETSLSYLRTGSAVFVGGFDNAWTLRLTNQLRFHFANTADMGVLRIVDTANPGRNRWAIDRGMSSTINNHRDYAIVARFTPSSTGKPAIVMAGVGSAGTLAAGEFLSDANSLAQLTRDAVAAGNKRNMETVLSVQVVDGEPGVPTVEAVYFW